MNNSEHFLVKWLTEVVSDLFVHSFYIFCSFSFLYMLYEISLSIKPIFLIKLIILIEKLIIINYSHRILLSILFLSFFSIYAIWHQLINKTNIFDKIDNAYWKIDNYQLLTSDPFVNFYQFPIQSIDCYWFLSKPIDYQIYWLDTLGTMHSSGSPNPEFSWLL